MLDFDLSTTLNNQLWESLPTCAALPCDEATFLAGSGIDSMIDDTRRRFRRVKLHGRAAATCGNQTFGVYTIDVSPMGVSFYSPRNLLPKEIVKLSFEQFRSLDVKIRRCRRVAASCYSCGGDFTAGAMKPAEYREFLEAMKR